MMPKECVRDDHCALEDGYARFHELIRQIWPTATPLVMGPCDGMSVERSDDAFLNAFLNHTLRARVLDVVVMHSYNNDGGHDWQQPGFLQQTKSQAETMLALAQKIACNDS